jgi:hypothetical protein
MHWKPSACFGLCGMVPKAYQQLCDSDLIMMCMLIDDIVLATLSIHNINTLLYYEQWHYSDLIMMYMLTTLCLSGDTGGSADASEYPCERLE